MTRFTLAVAAALLVAGCGDDFQSPLFTDAPVTAMGKATVNPFAELYRLEILHDVTGKNWDTALRAQTPSGKWVRVTNEPGCPVTFGGGACLSSKTKLSWLREALVLASISPDPQKAREISPFIRIVEQAIRETTSP